MRTAVRDFRLPVYGHCGEDNGEVRRPEEQQAQEPGQGGDIEYEPIGLFSSMGTMEKGRAEYLKQQEGRGFNADEYRFTYERYAVDKLS